MTQTTRKEKWKPIPGYERYFVSECGRVWDSYRKILMKQTVTDANYLTVRLPQFNSPLYRKTMKVHRLVMKAFVGYKELPVNHKDKNRKNNHLENLEYLTARENEYHKHVTPLSPIRIIACHRCH